MSVVLNSLQMQISLPFASTVYLYFCNITFITGHRLGSRGIVVRFPVRTRDFSVLQRVQTSCGAYLALCSLGTKCVVGRRGGEV